ncbi:hypothetical protein [Leptolyngbya sp. FACHB-261]|uniref:hypothetical protein n=1 Tax=Leptolyngbya sp. FACHB-261 TaxID=2692806 RepID=UPI0016845289|nr:hypothetical protein [Leptolyngbya sp. FACHB-261]MBD2100268.1 hypothetical protein [Leptolyngbya sp. FACHB-261]
MALALKLLKSELPGKLIKNTVGTRNLASRGSEGGFNVLGFLGRAARLLTSGLSLLFGIGAFTLTSLWGLFTSTVQYIWQFNWNTTDPSIDAQMKNLWDSFGGLLGGLAGNAVGWLSCGILPGAVIFSFNAPMGAYVLKEVGEEAMEEFIGNLQVVVQSGLRSAVQAGILWLYKNVRRWLKQPGNKFGLALFGGDAEKLAKWGEQNSQPWSFAQAFENKIESIDNQFVQNFVEEFFDEAFDACVEAGYVVAGSIESYLATQRMVQEQALGKARTVEIQPDRTVENERLVLSGPEQLLKPALVQTLTQYQLLENRDVGAIVGAPLVEAVKGAAMARKLLVTFYSVKTPPWKARDGKELIRATYSIPDVKRSISWEQVKLACGGLNGYLWGRFRATAQLSNGRQMQVYGGSETDAEDRLKALLALSEATLQTLTIAEEKKEGRRASNTRLYKESIRVYPAFFTVINQAKLLNPKAQTPGARGLVRGDVVRNQARILLWPEHEPPDVAETLTELFKDTV